MSSNTSESPYAAAAKADLIKWIQAHLVPHPRCTMTQLQYWFPAQVVSDLCIYLDAAIQLAWVKNVGTRQVPVYSVTPLFTTTISPVKDESKKAPPTTKLEEQKTRPPNPRETSKVHETLLTLVETWLQQGLETMAACDHTSCKAHTHSLHPNKIKRAVPEASLSQILQVLRLPRWNLEERTEELKATKYFKAKTHSFFHYSLPSVAPTPEVEPTVQYPTPSQDATAIPYDLWKSLDDECIDFKFMNSYN